MKILCKSINNQQLSANQKVKQIGKYLYKNIDSAYKYKSGSNEYDVYITIYYQIPYWERIPGKGSDYNDMHEMNVNINLTTYQNKVRVNVIEMDPNERTLGFDLYKPEQIQDMQIAKDLIFNKVVKRITKAYEEYDFLF